MAEADGLGEGEADGDGEAALLGDGLTDGFADDFTGEGEGLGAKLAPATLGVGVEKELKVLDGEGEALAVNLFPAMAESPNKLATITTPRIKNNKTVIFREAGCTALEY